MSETGNEQGQNSGQSEAENHTRKQEKCEQLKKVISEQETRIQALETSAFQLANFYFVFQGVVFAAVSNSPSLTCSDAWYVFTPSALAAILNFCALFSIGSKYIRARNLHDKTWSEFNRCARLSSPRNYTTINRTDSDLQDQSVQHGADNFSQWRRYVLLLACMFLFIAFTGVTLSGPWTVVCKHEKKKRIDQGFDCMELCNGSKCMIFCYRS